MLADANPLLALAVILVAGLAGGQVAHWVRLPRIIGQILVGVLIGHSALDLIPEVSRLDTVTQFALGLIALTVGEHLNVRALRNAGQRLALLLLIEALVVPLLVFAATYPLVRSPWLPLLLGAMAISTAPATIVALIKDTRSRGVFVKTLSAAVALNNIACIALFSIVRTAAQAGLASAGAAAVPFVRMLAGPAAQIGAAVAIGFGAGALLVLLTRHEVRSDRLVAASLIALLLVAGTALSLRLSPLLACLFLGVAVSNLSHGKAEVGGISFENMTTAVFAAFFTLAGMELQVGQLLGAGVLTAAVVAARFAAKIGSAALAMRLAGATAGVRRYLGLALVPQAGVAVGLILLVQQDPVLAPLHEAVLAVGLASVMFNELIGSLTAHYALRKSGDAGKDRPRLIDFIHEQHIVTDLAASTKEEAIAKLADVMIATHKLRVDRGEFLENFLAREREASTCVGSGLAIPHGTIKSGGSMIGVMGISREGLAIETPDGEPVHCMVLLATPESEKERHLEVIAALARAVGRDPGVQQQLFNASSPAHAYEVLHAEEATDFNYYLSE